MRQDKRPAQPIHRRTKLVGYSTPVTKEDDIDEFEDIRDVAAQPTLLMVPIDSNEGKRKAPTPPPRLSLPLRVRSSSQADSRKNLPMQSIPDTGDDPGVTDISAQSTASLIQLSGMMRAIRLPEQYAPEQDEQPFTPVPSFIDTVEGEFWPHGIQQTGPLPVINLYGSEPFGRIVPPVAIPQTPQVKQQPVWKRLLSAPAVRISIGLLIGIALLLLVAQFVNVPMTIQVLRQNLATPRGLLFALLSGIAFLTAWGLRGYRWKLFLNPVCKLSTFRVIQLFLIGTFLNFLLPVRGGEVAKSLMLKRIAGVPISKSLPTIAMDKALDLLPALFIMVIVPFLGIEMDIKIWLILIAVGGLLVGMTLFVGLAAWKRAFAISLLHKLIGILPAFLASRIEGFTTGFVDSLLMGASRPKVFIQAILLTCVAVFFEGLFAMLAFWTIGFHISYGAAIFGYTLYNMFYILPTPPGQVGSNEAVGLLVFTGLLELPADRVTAMFVFSHPWAALLMTTIGMACLSSLGLTISSAMKVQDEDS